MKKKASVKKGKKKMPVYGEFEKSVKQQKPRKAAVYGKFDEEAKNKTPVKLSAPQETKKPLFTTQKKTEETHPSRFRIFKHPIFEKKEPEGAWKKLEKFDNSFGLLKDMLEEFRNENQELRKDRQFLLEKLKNLIINSEQNKKMAEPEEEEETYKEESHKKDLVSANNPEEDVHRSEKEKKAHLEKSIETPLDRLLELVMKNDKINFSQAAKIFHVKDKQIEEWAQILEDHGLVEIHYPAIGKPVLKRKY